MHTVWIELREALEALDVEIGLQVELDIFGCLDRTDEPEIFRVLKFLGTTAGRDVEVAKNALRLARSYAAKLAEHRELHAFRDAFLPKFEEFMKEQKFSEEKAVRLTDELFSFKNATAVKKWWGKLKSAENRRSAEEAHRNFLASTKREGSVVNSVQEAGREQCDLKLQNLKERASRVESEEGKMLYKKGLNAPTRHDQIRLLKAAIRLEEQNNAIPPKEEKSVVQSMPHVVKYMNLTAVVEERFKGLFCFVGDSNCQQMALEVVRVLARFGRREMFVGESYLPLNMLRKLVRRNYRLRLEKPFNPSNFFVIVGVLVRSKILIKYDGKAEDSMMSLSSHVNEATTAEARHIIATVLALKRETSNGATGNHAG